MMALNDLKQRKSGRPRRPAGAVGMGILVLTASLAFSQGIRKNYTEMTPEEKNALVSAFKTVGTPNPSLLRDLANFHSVNFDPGPSGIHFALNEAGNNFHAWHRYASFELEQEMQKSNRHVTLPYWDWTVNRSITDALWATDFMGQFDALWGLGRRLGGGTLPTAMEVATAQNKATWWPDILGNGQGGYSRDVEATNVHGGAHGWVGGYMNQRNSPMDPVFWLHHNNIDRLWQLWEDQETAVKSTHTRTTIARYNGTYRRPDGVLLPSIDPDAIVDSRNLGVFYAGNQLAILDNYTVANKTRNPEQFTYKYTIQAKNFKIPSGKVCEFRSSTGIELQSGFEVQSGGSFTANVISTGSILAKEAESEFHTIEPEMPQKDFSKPFSYHLTPSNRTLTVEFPVWFSGDLNIQAEVWDLKGNRTTIPLISHDGVYLIRGALFDLTPLRTIGIHYFRISAAGEHYSGQLLLNK
jgi:tyrosinase